MTKHARYYKLSSDEADRIKAEVLLVGDLGPGPRRLLRWCAGAVATKDVLRVGETEAFADLLNSLTEHIST
eukprot:1393330-Pyramimonas_sp.AAC.1